MKAETVIEGVALELHDPTHARWSLEWFAEALTSALRAVVMIRPDSTRTTAAVTLQEGAIHAIPDDGLRFISLTCNIDVAGSPGPVITECNAGVLNRFDPGWRQATPVSEVEHFLYDERRPTEFMTVPRVQAGTRVEIVYARDPGPIEAPAGDDAWPEIIISSEYEAAVRHWLLYRAYARQTSAIGKEMAVNNYRSFFQTMGEKPPGQMFISPDGDS